MPTTTLMGPGTVIGRPKDKPCGDVHLAEMLGSATIWNSMPHK